MGVEKEGSTNGGSYVGGFFQLFDWTAKSRKKLFSSKSDFPERTKQGKRSDGNVPMTRINLMDEDEIGARTSFKGSDYSCASSVTDDDMYGAKAPNVVAKLMGLDALPTSSDPYSTPFFDAQSLRDAHLRNRNLNYHHNERIVYPDDPFNKVESGFGRNFAELEPQKMISRPIEKFRTESLPPKAAKTIPITHHKLLSPIKSASFFPTKDAAHIMEAAARMIEPGPQVVTRAKMPSIGSSSVHVKIRDFKEKMEAAQRKPPVRSSSVPVKVRDSKEKSETANKSSRLTETSRKPVESNAVKYLKGQPLNKSWNGSIEKPLFRTSDTEEICSVLKNEGKSISLAIQAKVNVQKREGLTSRSRRSSLGFKDESEVKSNQHSKSQPSSRNSLHKKSSMHNASGVLRTNNQKQNCITDNGKLQPSKPIGSNLNTRKVLIADSVSGRHKASGKTVGNSKIGTRKFEVGAMDSERGPYSSTKNPRKKRSVGRDYEFRNNQVVDRMLIDNPPKEDHVVTERSLNWIEDSKMKGMDVVSFTFTAPLTRSMETPMQNSEKNNSSTRFLLDTESTKSYSLGYNVIGGDALSMLLEQKLRELSNAVESSCKKPLNSRSPSTSTSFSHDMDLSSTDFQPSRSKHKFQNIEGVDEMDECSSNQLDARQPSPISILEPSFSTESCNSSESMDSFRIDGNKRCSPVQTPEVLRLSPLKKLRTLESDMELSDSASSISSRSVAKSHRNIVATSDPTTISTNGELEYVKLIVCNAELMFKDFAVGRTRGIINPRLFDQLESRRGGFEEKHRLERKVLFDSVSECLDSRCMKYASGGRRTLAKGMAILRRKERLAEEVYKEISRWRAMGDCMVDELVDDAMSNLDGKWREFEVDGFEIVTEIEGEIMKALVDEMVADILLL